MKNLKKLWFGGILVILFVLVGCPGPDSEVVKPPVGGPVLEYGISEWTVSGKKFDINTGTYAEILQTFQKKNDVLHIKPANNSTDYSEFVIQFNLSEYAGKNIKIEMSMDVWLKKPAGIEWLINSSTGSSYPEVYKTVSALSQNTWQNLVGSCEYDVPNTATGDDDGKILFLSGLPIDGAEAYFANTRIRITNTALVNAETPIITAQPAANVSWNVGSETTKTLTVTANVTDGGTLSYQWYSNTVSGGKPIIEGGNSATLSLDKTKYTTDGEYSFYVMIINTITDNSDGGIKTYNVFSTTATVTVSGNTSPVPLFEGTFVESDGWQSHEDWARWNYTYQDPNNLFDLDSMFNNNKVYILTYSFSSNIDMERLTCYFYNCGEPDWNWKLISQWGAALNIDYDIIKDTKYSGKTIIIPNEDANGCDPEITYLCFEYSNNRSVSTQAILSFYEFSLEEVDMVSSIDKWTVSGEEFKINTGTNAELTTFDSKSNVLHIKPAYGLDHYDSFVIQYDLNSYKGKTIDIQMSMDVYVKKNVWIAWQINSTPVPFYPVVCGTVPPGDAADGEDNPTSPALSANTWHTLTRTYTYTVPNTPPENDNGKKLYLSGMQIYGAEAYFADASITITEKP